MSEVSDFYKKYADQGFSFPASILTRYALSLSTKPLVILSGISGTGKTKIGQLFNPLAFKKPPTEVPVPAASPSTDNLLRIRITTDFLGDDGRANFEKKYLNLVFEKPELDMIQEKGEELKKAGKTDNVIPTQRITIRTPQPNSENLTFAVYVQRANSQLIRIRARSVVKDPNPFDSRPYLNAHYKVNDFVVLEKIGPYLFQIIDVNSAVAKSSEMQVAEEEIDFRKLNNTLFLPVQSDWVDRTPLFGAFNQLSGKYEVTAFLSFVLSAREYPNIPFFVILDEMNLAKVEHYFSDYLSCLESRTLSDGKVLQEPIILHDKGQFALADNDEIEEIPSRLELPLNLYVTGSVNIDETTYMFSPKVLDRANVIEFNDVELGLLDGSIADNSDFKLKLFPQFGMQTPASRDDFKTADPILKTLLNRLVAILQPYSLHFGYRVAVEVSRFVNEAIKVCEATPHLLSTAIDIQLVQKILPKFNGSQGQLDEPLRKLLAEFLLDHPTLSGVNFEDITYSWVAGNASSFSGSKYPLTCAKLGRMICDLHVRGFTSFIG